MTKIETVKAAHAFYKKNNNIFHPRSLYPTFMLSSSPATFFHMYENNSL
jgi:hypothetical protein